MGINYAVRARVSGEDKGGASSLPAIKKSAWRHVKASYLRTYGNAGI